MSSDGGDSSPGGSPTNIQSANDASQQQQEGPPADANQDEDGALETSFFPSPAHYYKRYTPTNLALPQDAIISDGTDSYTRAELEPPNVEWIVEGGTYSVFGDTWPVEEVSPTLAEQGVREMFRAGEGEVSARAI